MFKRISTAARGRLHRGHDMTALISAQGEETECKTRSPSDATLLQTLLKELPEHTSIHIYMYGRPAAGRMCLIRRLSTGVYLPDYDPTGVDTWQKHLFHASNRRTTVHLQSATPVIPVRTPFGSDEHILNFFVLAFKVTDSGTYEQLSQLYNSVLGVRDSGGEVCQWQGGIAVALACDMATDRPEDVGGEDAERFANEKKLLFWRTSAYTGEGCQDEDFNRIMGQLLVQRQRSSPSDRGS